MEEPFNPYAAEQTQDAYSSSTDAVSVSSEAFATMLRMKFWVKFAGVAMLGIIILIVLSVFIELSVNSSSRAVVAIISSVIPLTVLGVIMTRTLNYSSSIEKMRKSMNSIDLSASIKAQHSFWIVMGIALAVVVGIYFLICISMFK